MRTSVRLCGTVAVSAASLALLAAPAFADSAGNNGLNLADDNNVSVLPVQICNSGPVNVLAVPVHLLSDSNSQSPQNVNCVDAPIVDHPSLGS